MSVCETSVCETLCLLVDCCLPLYALEKYYHLKVGGFILRGIFVSKHK